MNIFHWLATRHAYEHEVAATLEVPAFVQRGQSAIISATVRNKGSEDETDVKACLWVSGEEVQLIDILHIQSGEPYTFEYSWSPTTDADFNVTVYVCPVAEENLTANNFATTVVPVFYYERHYFANRWTESGVPMGWHADSGSWPYTLTFDFPLYNHVYRTIYVSTNGLITFAATNPTRDRSAGALAGLFAIAPAWHDWSTTGDQDIYIGQPDPSHVLVRWEVVDSSSVAASFAAELGADGAIQFFYGFSNKSAAAIIGISNGEGYVLVENVENVNYLQTVVFTPFELEHEMSVTLQAPKFISVGTTVLLNVTVSNLGSVSETNIFLQLLANESTVESLTLYELNKGSFNRTSILWAPPAQGQYNLTAYVSPVPGEVYTGDNSDWRTVFVATNATTYVSVEPHTITVEVGEEFIVDIYVNSVENLYTWQIKLYYDETVFRCLEAWLPSDNVFAYSIPLVPPPMIEGNYTLVGATLMGSEWSFTGCGTLCKIRFKVIKSGNCTMLFDDVDTFLLNSGMNSMDFKSVSGYAEVWLPDFNNDGIVDSADIALIARAFGMRQGDQDWNPILDTDNDSKVNMFDIARAARAYCGSS
jgi:hypothetical protein